LRDLSLVIAPDRFASDYPEKRFTARVLIATFFVMLAIILTCLYRDWQQKSEAASLTAAILFVTTEQDFVRDRLRAPASVVSQLKAFEKRQGKLREVISISTTSPKPLSPSYVVLDTWRENARCRETFLFLSNKPHVIINYSGTVTERLEP
jgi:hypothetical protein